MKRLNTTMAAGRPRDPDEVRHDDHQGIGMGHCVMALDMANRKRTKEKKT